MLPKSSISIEIHSESLVSIMGKVRVLVVDDHPVVQEGLVRLLDSEPGLECVGVASNGKEAVEMTRKLQPDVVLMDIAMPKMDGIEATKQIKLTSPKTIILALTAYGHAQFVLACLKAGIDGYLLKNAPRSDIANAIMMAKSGSGVFNLRAAMGVIRGLVVREGKLKTSYGTLRPREIEVLGLASRGFSNKRIAEELSISENTVCTHMFNIFRKLNVNSRVEAILVALKGGIISSDGIVL